MMKRNIIAAFLLISLSSCGSDQKPDLDYNVSVKNPAYKSQGPAVLFDEAHHNFHTSTGTYAPLVNLIKNDGYKVTANEEPFTYDKLKQYNILIISNAKGSKRKFDPAFTKDECSAVSKWVSEGGSLLLIADHYPFGGAAGNLAKSFGVRMWNGETGDSVNFQGNTKFKDELVFSRENKLLQDNLITQGATPDQKINKVVTFRGQALSIPDSALVLLKLSPHAFQSLPDSIWEKDGNTYTRFSDPISASGNCQALALQFGKGRVVILGEAAMITAQITDGNKSGMNSPGNDNKQFALNIFHWLSHKL